MNPHATVTLTYHGLELRCEAARLSEDRQLADKDYKLLASWATRHRQLARDRKSDAGLLQLGQEIFEWLNGPAQFLSRLTDSSSPPLRIDFATARQDSPQARAFLDAPWELLAHDGSYWSLREDTIFCPIRRIGAAAAPPQPSPNRLSVVFMAAAPRGADNLSYEAEEASILTATKNLGVDLVVEESGELGLLSACVAREKPDVVQLSCHGTLNPEPGLLLEDDTGDRDFVNMSQLVNELASHHPRLLFLSACETAEADPVLDSLARSLVRSGAPAVLGWAAPVLDNEATLFASYLYARLTKGEDVAHALAYARVQLGHSRELPDRSLADPRSRDWHLARLYLDANGGGALATADGPRRVVGGVTRSRPFSIRRASRCPLRASWNSWAAAGRSSESCESSARPRAGATRALSSTDWGVRESPVWPRALPTGSSAHTSWSSCSGAMMLKPSWAHFANASARRRSVRSPTGICPTYRRMLETCFPRSPSFWRARASNKGKMPAAV